MKEAHKYFTLKFASSRILQNDVKHYNLRKYGNIKFEISTSSLTKKNMNEFCNGKMEK